MIQSTSDGHAHTKAKALNFRKENEVKLEYATRIFQAVWEQHKDVIRSMHSRRLTRQEMLFELEEKYCFRPSLGQLNAQMKTWGLHSYRPKQMCSVNSLLSLDESATPDNGSETLKFQAVATYSKDSSDNAHALTARSASLTAGGQEQPQIPLRPMSGFSIPEILQPHKNQQPWVGLSRTFMDISPLQSTSFRSINSILIPRLPKTERSLATNWMCSDPECYKRYSPYELRARWIALDENRRQAMEDRWIAKVAHETPESFSKAFEDFCDDEISLLKSPKSTSDRDLVDLLHQQRANNNVLCVQIYGSECSRRMKFSTLTMFQLLRVPSVTEPPATGRNSLDDNKASVASPRRSASISDIFISTHQQDHSRLNKGYATSKKLCARSDISEDIYNNMLAIDEDDVDEATEVHYSYQAVVLPDTDTTLGSRRGLHFSDRELDSGSMRSFESLALRLKRKNPPGYLSSSSGGMTTDTDGSWDFHRVTGIPSVKGRNSYFWSDEEIAV